MLLILNNIECLFYEENIYNTMFYDFKYTLIFFKFCLI